MTAIKQPTESFMHKLRSLLVMVERGGTEHERDLAQLRLNQLLDKYGLTLDDIDPENKETYWFSYKTSHDKQLLLQVYYLVTNTEEGQFWQMKGKRKIGIDLTRAEYIEIDRLYEFWRKALKKEIDRFVRAFIQANEIFGTPDDNDETEPLTAEKIRILRMAATIEAKRPFLELAD